MNQQISKITMAYIWGGSTAHMCQKVIDLGDVEFSGWKIRVGSIWLFLKIIVFLDTHAAGNFLRTQKRLCE